MAVTPDEQAEIDAALDAALDLLDDSESGAPADAPTATRFSAAPPSSPTVRPTAVRTGSAFTASPSRKTQSTAPAAAVPAKPPVHGPTPPPTEDEFLNQMMSELLKMENGQQDMSPDVLAKMMQDLTSMQAESKAPARPAAAVPAAASPRTNVNEAIDTILESQKNDQDSVYEEDDFDPTDASNMLDGLMQQMGDMDPDAMIEGMMEQLISKDLMYEPIKQITEQFPKWLEEHKGSLPATEWAM